MGSDFPDRHAEHLRCRNRMDISAAVEAVDHGLVARDVREYAQLNLRIVRIHQHTARLRHKHFPDFSTQIRTNRDILQIRLR